MSLTVLLHVAQIVLYPPLDAASQRSVRQSQPPADALQLARQSQPPSAIEPALLPPLATTAAAVRGGGGGERLMIVTATQPGPCTTRRGDHVLSLALKNKWQFATMHGHGMWLSSELLSPWDLAGQWNKVAVLAALMQPASEARGGASWLLWADDDVLFSDMSFRFPLDQYEAQEAWLVLWGDERMTYELGDSEGVNTGTMLLRVCDWSRALLEAMTRLASSSLRPVLTNHDQGGLVHLLHTAPERWRRHTRLERDYTMNGHWPSYTGAFTLGAATLRSPVWGSSALPVIVHYSGCQMCRGHSFNGTWTDRGVAECVAAFTANYIFADDQSLRRLGLRHTRLGMPGVRPAEGSPLFARHAKLTRCMPRFLVVGTQKGGTSTLHYVLRSGWHPRVALNKGEKEVHHFSLDDNHAMGPARYQARWDGEGAELGTCPGREDEVRGEVSATYLDYPRAAERAFALLPYAKVVLLLREPAARLVSSFNMRWQVEVCGKLTWTRRDCFKGLSSREQVKEHAVGPFQLAAALKVWGRCQTPGGDGLDASCLGADFVDKLANRTRRERREIDVCLAALQVDAPPLSLGRCLGLPILSQRKLYKRMEDGAYVYRSMYVEHVAVWLSYFPPEQLLVLPSEPLFERATVEAQMSRLAAFLGLDYGETNKEVLFSASPASVTGAPHENGREYVATPPPEMLADLRAWLCPHNARLAGLLLANGLLPSASGLSADLPWAAAPPGGPTIGCEPAPAGAAAPSTPSPPVITAQPPLPTATNAETRHARDEGHKRRRAKGRPKRMNGG